MESLAACPPARPLPARLFAPALTWWRKLRTMHGIFNFSARRTRATLKAGEPS